MERLVYLLRNYPRLSETFVAREIRGLLRTGVPVSVLAMEPPPVPPPPGGDGAGDPGPEVSYLTVAAPARSTAPRPRGRPAAALLPALLADLVRLGGRPRASARLLRLAALALRARDLLPADTARLHVHFANYAGTVARYLSLLTKVPYSITAHAYDIYQEPFLLAPNLAGADRIFTVSRANRELLTTLLGRERGAPRRVELLHCGIDLLEFPFREPAPPATPARLVCVARLVAKKGHAVLLEALSLLRAEGREIVLEVVGEGPLEGALRERAARPDLAGVVSLTGPLAPAAALERVRAADLMVLASRVAEDGDRDGLPVTLVEALALGTPVVSTSVAGIPELIRAETGWLAEPDRPDRLAAAIRAALAAPQAERVARARRGRALVEAEFDLGRQVETLREMLR